MVHASFTTPKQPKSSAKHNHLHPVDLVFVGRVTRVATIAELVKLLKQLLVVDQHHSVSRETAPRCSSDNLFSASQASRNLIFNLAIG